MPFSFLFVSKGAEKAFSAELFAYLSEILYFCIEFLITLLSEIFGGGDV